MVVKIYLLREKKLSDIQPYSSRVNVRFVFHNTDNDVVQVETKSNPTPLSLRLGTRYSRLCR